MKYSTRLSDAIHALVLIQQNSDPTLSSTNMATSIQTNPSYVRQLMASMKAAGIIQSIRGQAVPTLNRPPEQITLLDVYRAVEKDKPLLHLDTHTNPECGVGINIQLALSDYYARVQEKAEQEMAQITLQNIIDSFLQRI